MTPSRPPAPLPPRHLMKRVGALPDDSGEERFLRVGRGAAERVHLLLPAGWSFEGKRALDFGCGPGRVLRHFEPEARVAELWGCDLQGESIDWVNEHLPWVHAYRNEPLPPLPHADGYFDLIWGFSVFTHIDVDWAHWLLELRRVLADDGLLILTFLDNNARRWEEYTGEPWDEERVGMITFGTGTPVEGGGPVVFHSRWWIEAHWGRAFQIVEIGDVDGGPQGHVVMRKRPGEVDAEQLERPEPGEPRELIAAMLQVRLSRRELGEARVRAAESEAAVATERDRLREQVEAVRASRSWRWTRPLREMRGRARGVG